MRRMLGAWAAAAIAFAPGAARAARAAEVGPDAVWEPPMGTAAAFRDQCKSKPVPDVRACLLAFMHGAGATSAAVDFARRLGGEGYLRGFEEKGRVDVARVRYPFRANANDAILLVNGEPPQVDVMDYALLGPLMKDPRLAELAAAVPGASLWEGYGGPAGVKPRPGGGLHFIFSLRVRTCRACADLAKAFVGYDFDADGKFLGVRLLGLKRPSAFSVSGTVERGKTFEAPIDSSTTFRLEPFPEGWTVAVKDAAGRDYCAMVTPPFHGPNALAIYGWHFKPGANAPGKVRDFRCVETPEQYRAAADALNKLLWGPPAERGKARAAHEKLSAEARAGRLTVSSLALAGLPGDEAPAISSMTFRFELFAR